MCDVEKLHVEKLRVCSTVRRENFTDHGLRYLTETRACIMIRNPVTFVAEKGIDVRFDSVRMVVFHTEDGDIELRLRVLEESTMIPHYEFLHVVVNGEKISLQELFNKIYSYIGRGDNELLFETLLDLYYLATRGEYMCYRSPLILFCEYDTNNLLRQIEMEYTEEDEEKITVPMRNVKVQTARKERVCQFCGRTVHRGEKYVSFTQRLGTHRYPRRNWQGKTVMRGSPTYRKATMCYECYQKYHE